MRDERGAGDMDSGSDDGDGAFAPMALHVVLEGGSDGGYFLKHLVTGERVPVPGVAG